MSADLHTRAHNFACKINHILNATVCEGVRITAVISPDDPHLIHVGHGLTKTVLEGTPFPVKIGRRKPRCWLDIGYRFCWDPEQTYETVERSYFGMYADEDGKHCLAHVDYERGKKDQPPGYPEAHIQIYGASDALDQWRGWDGSRGLHRLHFPAGGRRFRPILEDVVEFLIVERLAEGRPRSLELLERERQEFQRHQLRAAIRRNLDIAREAVQEFDRDAG
jgi:hypothetical protein